jgi:hypothetical protein
MSWNNKEKIEQHARYNNEHCQNVHCLKNLETHKLPVFVFYISYYTHEDSPLLDYDAPYPTIESSATLL